MSDLPASSAQPGTPDIRTYQPADRLRPLVTAYYFLESPDPFADFIHPELANIRFSIAGRWMLQDMEGKQAIEAPHAALFGPSDRGRRFDTEGGLVMGVSLTAIGWLMLIGGNASAFANMIVPLDRQLGVSGFEIHKRLAAATDDSARIAILNAILCGRPVLPSAYCSIAVQIQNAISSGKVEHVADLANELGVEQRRLSRACISAFGFSPVRLLRRQRFLRTLIRMRDRGDQAIGQFIDPSYYDQAHFNRDFKTYMGMTPLAYFRLPHDAMGRAGV
jgi:AraC-like DNA-binding protein